MMRHLEVTIVGSLSVVLTGVLWILKNGIWNDNGVWVDSNVWKDS